eukprot:TRINITY_DN21895_c0_g1_i2.p1 TRINITY_DN21895_c0_g1~~TRINITY_DN21895_c0_g1_i2.p1  ORF type:complete len:233 (+),score=28.92 TRINITY_DN21895_c0_g1_i2:99-797(+)
MVCCGDGYSIVGYACWGGVCWLAGLSCGASGGGAGQGGSTGRAETAARRRQGRFDDHLPKQASRRDVAEAPEGGMARSPGPLPILTPRGATASQWPTFAPPALGSSLLPASARTTLGSTAASAGLRSSLASGCLSSTHRSDSTLSACARGALQLPFSGFPLSHDASDAAPMMTTQQGFQAVSQAVRSRSSSPGSEGLRRCRSAGSLLGQGHARGWKGSTRTWTSPLPLQAGL